MKNVVFMGTPDFAVPALKCLIENDVYDVKLVISQPDKPQGRHQILTPSPVKELALQYDIEVYQPKSLKTDAAYEKIKSCEPEFIVVSAYGKILPQCILDIPKYGCVNLHGSILPKYRGAAPIQWAVINGDKIAGVTTMLMSAGLDEGDILLVSETEITENETAGELFDDLAALCPDLLITTMQGLENGTITPIKQDNEKASYVGMLSKNDSVIDWSQNASVIHNKIRGMYPWPIAKTIYKNKILKIHSSRCTDIKRSGKIGEVIIEKNNIYVLCGDGKLLQIVELQLEGSKKMNAADFLRGHNFEKGFVFSN